MGWAESADKVGPSRGQRWASHGEWAPETPGVLEGWRKQGDPLLGITHWEFRELVVTPQTSGIRSSRS